MYPDPASPAQTFSLFRPRRLNSCPPLSIWIWQNQVRASGESQTHQWTTGASQLPLSGMQDKLKAARDIVWNVVMFQVVPGVELPPRSGWEAGLARERDTVGCLLGAQSSVATSEF